MQLSRRLRALPPYHFAAYNAKIAELRAAGRDIINLSIGDPDLPMPEEVLDTLVTSTHEPHNQRYPEYEGMAQLRQAFAAWFARRFGVELNPQREMLTLIGSKEGLAHLPQAVMDDGDVALIPNVAYPVYSTAVALAGGVVYELPVTEEGSWLPNLDAIPADTLARAKTLWLNYPNNPTGAAAPLSFFEQAVAFAHQHDLLLIHDMAYAEVRYEGARPHSVLEIPGAKDVAVEFHSFSKAYNMAGVRLGMMVGNAAMCEGLTRLKSNLDTGVFRPLQVAGARALELPESWLEQRNAIYQRRRDLLVDTFRTTGLHVATPEAGLYLWPHVPDGATSADFALRLLDETSIAITPGTNFGPGGEGYLRVSLTAPDEAIAAAASRLRAAVPRVAARH
jgi:LL-diaminopimelate aminotransferase